MRILLHGINYAPEPTGIGKYTADMAEWLVNQGHEVHCITAMPHYPHWKLPKEYQNRSWHQENINGVTVYRTPLYVPPANGVSSALRILMESSFAIASLRWWIPLLFKRERFDIAITVSPPLQVAILPNIYCRIRSVPSLLHIQDLQVDAAVRLGMIPKGPLTRFLYWVEAQLISQATRTSTITKAMGNRVLEKGVVSDNLIIFPNWSDIDFVKPVEPDPLIRNKLGAAADDLLVLYSGNMGEKQGLELIIRAAHTLKGRQNIRFALIGAGTARIRLEELIKSLNLGNVEVSDLVPWEKMPALLSSADIHLVIQRAETADLVMPSKLVNILAAGRASISTADPGTALYDTVHSNRMGLVIPPDNHDELVEAINHLAEDPQLRIELGANARAYAEDQLCQESILKRLERALIVLSQ